MVRKIKTVSLAFSRTNHVFFWVNNFFET